MLMVGPIWIFILISYIEYLTIFVKTVFIVFLVLQHIIASIDFWRKFCVYVRNLNFGVVRTIAICLQVLYSEQQEILNHQTS